jgi:hypothetical protein
VQVLLCRVGLGVRPAVVSLETLLAESAEEEEDRRESAARRLARRWLLPGLPARLLHATVLFLATAGWAFFLAHIQN